MTVLANLFTFSTIFRFNYPFAPRFVQYEYLCLFKHRRIVLSDTSVSPDACLTLFVVKVSPNFSRSLGIFWIVFLSSLLFNFGSLYLLYSLLSCINLGITSFLLMSVDSSFCKLCILFDNMGNFHPTMLMQVSHLNWRHLGYFHFCFHICSCLIPS